MRLVCKNCNFELKLTIKSVPKNAKLYCPKCKNVLTPIETDLQNNMTPGETETIKTTTTTSYQIETKTIPSITPHTTPPTIPQPSERINPTTAQNQLFSEDIKPDIELTQSEEEVLKKREELFARPEQVWYDTQVKPPSIPQPQLNPQSEVSLSSPPPLPPNIPPPIPSNIPPPIPITTQPIQKGYISASSNIQIDSSLIMPSSTPTQPQPTPTESEKIELVTETNLQVQEKELEQPTVDQSNRDSISNLSTTRVETAEKKDVIILSSQPYMHKKVSITMPAIFLILLACIAGFIYYQIVVSSSKSDFIKDLKSTPALGSIPAIQTKESQEKSPKKEPLQSNSDSQKPISSKIPIKAKKSALEHYKRGNQYYMESKYEQARDEYAMAIAADPTFGLAYRGLGTTYAKLGQPDLAVKNYEKYIEIMPNATDAEPVSYTH
ncbi:MAG: hypothetical protein N2746_03265, partial [Deltaproteobacteria bacterium]|nr:hypothetical protein [Deltaproteobacteria bacterium]